MGEKVEVTVHTQGGTSWQDWFRPRVAAVVALVALVGVGTAWAITASASSSSPVVSGRSAKPKTMEEYVAGHWVRFVSPEALSTEQWSVADDYANFSSAVLAVYATHSVAPLAVAVSPQSHVVAMFGHDLATGTDPEALYADQYAPWQFVGDNRVGGVDTPWGVG